MARKKITFEVVGVRNSDMRDTKGNVAPGAYQPLVNKFLDLFPGVLCSMTHAEIALKLMELQKSDAAKSVQFEFQF
ncbi:MAG: hypothetical protein WC647_04040 [Desulfomonilaceae bacterium]|jgi:hypothetical protein